MLCPRCQRETPEGREDCAVCGVIFSRYRPRPVAAVPDQATEDPPLWRQASAWLKERMFDIPPAEDRGWLGLRAAFLVFLGLWGLRLLALPYQGDALGGSFMHLIHLPFHEAGHFVFQPLGTFLHILGGTLGQLLVPFIVACAFLREENPYGASVGLWWLGQSFMDCAPYINDARERTLMLISGETGQEDFEGHDWYQLLSRTDWLAHDHAIARAFWLFGVGLMVAALAWGAYILWRQTRPALPEPLG